jgi:hypothetical protein
MRVDFLIVLGEMNELRLVFLNYDVCVAFKLSIFITRS